ncbi:MAG: hypothetical protein KDA81_02030, partial [Planctomycetaceae bacterium]|nr:hypothetical protein [Planctomycetaceae bacterium]
LGDSVELATTGTGKIDINATAGKLQMAPNAMLQTVLGNIEASAGTNIIVGEITATLADVILSAGSGFLRDADGSDTDVNVTAQTLIASAGTSITLESTINSLSAVSGTGDISLKETDDLLILNVSSTEGDVLIQAGDVTTAGSLSVTGPISTPGNSVRLVVHGNLEQDTAGPITAASLGIRQQNSTFGTVQLDDANDVDNIAVLNAASGQSVVLKDSDNLTITSIAGQTIGNVMFTTTNGVQSSDGNILIETGSSLQIDQPLNAGTADVRLVSGTSGADGTVAQSAVGIITATHLGIRQQSASSGSVQLGTAANDADVLAVNNVAQGDEIAFFDVDELLIGRVDSQTTGNITFAETTGVDSNAGSINITSDGTLTIQQNIDATDDSSTAGTDESITLISRNGDIVLDDAANSVTITSDENPAPGVFDDVTGDQLTIIAGSSNGGGTVTLGVPGGQGIEIRTDGGVARQIAPRPTAFAATPTVGAQTAFVTLSDAATMRSSLTFQDGGFLGLLELVFGIDGEENLEVVVDWGVVSLTDLTASGPAGDASPVTGVPGAFEFSLADADKTVFYIDAGGQQYEIPHIYGIYDLVTTPNDRNGRQFNPGIIGVRFSVAQHESIQIWGRTPTDAGTVSGLPVTDFQGTSDLVTDAAGQTINPAATTLGLLSSTDTNNLRALTQQAASLPLSNITVTPTGIPEGLAEWEFIAGPSPGIVPSEPQDVPEIDIPPVEVPVTTPIVSEITGDVSFSSGAVSDAAIGTEVYLQIRRQYELDSPAEVVISRIQDSTFISSREEFEAFVREHSELQDGAGYEVWLVTETSGQRVERPIVQFEITAGRPGPASEELPDTFEPYQLKEVPFEQPQQDPAGEPSDNSDVNEIRNDDEADVSLLNDSGENIVSTARTAISNPPAQAHQNANRDSSQSQRVPLPDPGIGHQSSVESDRIDVDSHVAEDAAVLLIPAISFSRAARWKRQHQATTHSMTARTIRRMQTSTTAPKSDRSTLQNGESNDQ